MRRLTFDQGLSVAMTELTNQVVEATRKTRLTACLLFGVWMETLERPLRRRRRRGDKERRQGNKERSQGNKERRQGNKDGRQGDKSRRHGNKERRQGNKERRQGSKERRW